MGKKGAAKPVQIKIDLSSAGIFTWVKDKKFRFISCSENLTKLAGEDSPKSMIGKDDFSLVWRKDASFFREKDGLIFNSQVKYINVIEAIDVSTDAGIEKQHILITKSPLFNRSGKCIGIAGSHINLPGYSPAGVDRHFIDEQGRLWLPEGFGSEYLTRKEVAVLRLILAGKTSKQTAKVMGISFRTVEEYTQKIRKKFQCSHKNEIHSVAIEYGITHLL